MSDEKPTLDYATPQPRPDQELLDPAEFLKLIWAALILAGVCLLLRLFFLAFTNF